MFGFLGFPYIKKRDCYNRGYPKTESQTTNFPNQQLINHQLTKRHDWDRPMESGNIVTEAFIVKPVIDALHGWTREPTSSGLIEAGWT